MELLFCGVCRTRSARFVGSGAVVCSFCSRKKPNLVVEELLIDGT